MKTVSRLLLIGVLVAASACAASVGPQGSPSRPDAPDPSALATCGDAFEAWVEGSEALNEDGDAIELVVDLERIQRRVFETCTLAEVEHLNQEMPLEPASGVQRRLIEPDIRTFAETECVDEGPLLDGTDLCAEVGAGNGAD